MQESIKGKRLFPCYFFYGEEIFLAYHFARQLRESIVSPDFQELNVEKYDLEEASWAEIVDAARTMPIFLSPWRIIVVEVPENGKTQLSSGDEKMLRDYFSSPPSKSLVVIICPGKLSRSHALFKFFSSLPSHTVSAKEMKPLKGRALTAWIDRKLALLRKSMTAEAKQRLEEINGNDLARLDSELEKIAVFVGDKRVIELDDVNQVSGWAKASFEYELSNSLEKGNFKQGLQALQSLFQEGVKPEIILGMVARFFRDIFLAKLWLKERSKDRKEIFRALKPQIQEKYGDFYLTKSSEFFSLVERIPQNSLVQLIEDLVKIDLSLKTSDASLQPLLERFLYDFCLMRKEKRLF